MGMVNPPHPGDFVKTEVILPLGLTVVAAAKILGVSQPTLSTFLNGRTPSSCSLETTANGRLHTSICIV